MRIWYGSMAKSALASNPLRKLRKAANMTIEELSVAVDVSTKTLYLAEHGVYNLPLEAVVHYFTRLKDIDVDALNTEYSDFRRKMRANLANRIDESQWRFEIPKAQVNTFRTPMGTKMAPIRDFRLNSLMFTQTEFEKEFLVNPGLLTRLEAGRDFRSVPNPIAAALIECGAPENFMRELNVRTKLFHGTN